MKKDKEHTQEVINLDELGKLEHPLHTDSVIYPDGRTSDRDDDDPLFPDLELWNEEQVAEVTDQVLQMLNNLMREHHLNGTTLLAVLSRLTAAHIHVLKGACYSPEEKDAVESAYYKILEHYLAAFDVRDIQREVEQMKRERLN